MRAAAVVTAIASTMFAGCAAPADQGVTQTSTPDNRVTVYLGKDTAGDSKPVLYAHQVVVGAEPSVEAAVEALTAYDPAAPFYTLWNGFCALGEDLDGVTVTDRLITVHFRMNAGAICDLSEEGWQLRRQQIAWTVRTATGSDAPVRVTIGDDQYQAEESVVAEEKYLAASARSD